MDEFICPKCGKICKSNSGLSTHVKTCKGVEVEPEAECLEQGEVEPTEKILEQDEVIILTARKPISAIALKYLKQDLRNIELKAGLKIEIVRG